MFVRPVRVLYSWSRVRDESRSHQTARGGSRLAGRLKRPPTWDVSSDLVVDSYVYSDFTHCGTHELAKSHRTNKNAYVRCRRQTSRVFVISRRCSEAERSHTYRPMTLIESRAISRKVGTRFFDVERNAVCERNVCSILPKRGVQSECIVRPRVSIIRDNKVMIYVHRMINRL